MRVSQFFNFMCRRPAKKGVYLILGTLVACAIPGGSKGSKGSKGVREQDPWNSLPTSPTIDFSEKCGVDTNASANEPILAQDFQSLNFVIDNELLAIKAHIEANATLSISAMSDKSTKTVSVNITKAQDMSNIANPMSQLLTSIGAKLKAEADGGTKISKSMPRGDWLKLTDGSNPEYKDLLCVTSGTISQMRAESQNREYVFSPALVASVNPKASPEQFLTELGQGRKFSVTATLMDTPKKRSIQSTTGTVTFKPVSPTLIAVDPLTKKSVTINSDAAWEVISDFSGLSKSNDQLSGKLTFYVSHKNKKFDAIVQEAIRPVEGKTMMPPIILIAK